MKSKKELKKYLFNEIAKLLVVSILKISIGINVTLILFQLFNDILYGTDILVAVAYSIISAPIISLPIIVAAISIEKSLKIKLGSLTNTIIRLVKEIEKEVIEEESMAA